MIETVILPAPANNNTHIKEYLDYYTSFRHPPRFAVMLNGPWGIGKTHLIEEYLKCLKEREKKAVYVSLYGLNSVDEIDDALFRSIYPLLDSTASKVVGRVAKTAMRYFRVEDAVNIREFLNKFRADLYVFDDLERCEVPINNTLGYINEFVEHSECKVIILANEREIREGEVYQRRREKLIGKTLEVQSVFDEAMTDFIRQIDDVGARDFLKSNYDEISSIYRSAELNNLRVLQQTMWDFERFYHALSTRHRENKRATVVLLRMLFVLSFEIKAGRMAQGDILDRRVNRLVGANRTPANAEPSTLQATLRRYPGIELGDSILTDEALTDILFRGIIDKDEISVLLDKSAYFAVVADEPAWRTVWFAFERTETEFDRAFPKLEKQFEAREFKITGEILQVFGLRLWLARMGAISKSLAQIVTECEHYVDYLYGEGSLEPISRDAFNESRSRGYNGLGIREADTEEYGKIFNYLKEKRLKADRERYPALAAGLMLELKRDPELFLRRVSITNSEDNRYFDIPILIEINPDEFVTNLLQLHPAAQGRIFMALGLRYDTGELDRKLKAERPWLATVRRKLELAAETLPPVAKFRVLQGVGSYISPFLEDETADILQAKKSE